MDVRFLTADGVVDHAAADLPALLERRDGLVWVDVGDWTDDAAGVLEDVFHFHPLAVHDAMRRNQVPKVHLYPDHCFLVLHAPQAGEGGHVHFVELDQFIGDRFLVTTHGPLNPKADPAAARVEVVAVLGRLNSGKLRPQHGYELSHALLSALAGRLRTVHGRADHRRLGTRAAGDRRSSRRSGGVPRRDVPGQARTADGQDHVHAES